MFLPDERVFSNTISTLIGQDIEIYNTTGAIGAARACELHKGDFETFGKRIINNDFVMSFKPSAQKEAYKKAYDKWKAELENMLAIAK